MSADKFYDRELVTTGDGSSSIFLPQFNEHYHSHHGAVQESKHVFMKMGWEKVIPGKSQVDILEIGFGTGLNAYLVLDEIVDDAEDFPGVHYTALEAYPVDASMVSQLDYWKYGSYANPENNRDAFLSLHEATWNEPDEVYPFFIIEKRQVHLQDFVPQREYDLVFFDAFAPRVQPEMWTKEIFDKMYSLMKPDGILVTYCSKGEVRRNMIASGFNVEKVPGPPGKREMLRCSKF